MIIDTSDDRRLEVIHIDQTKRLFMSIEDQHGSHETIILDTEQAELLHSFLSTFFGETPCE